MIKRCLLASLTTLLIFALISCDGYNKLLKSDDFEKKYEAALDYYEKQDHFKAQQLFDELLVVFRGTPRAEKIYFKYAYSFYQMGDYLTAAFHFQRYATTFPNSEKAEEALYMSAYCKYLDSPPYSLDQTSTYQALEQLQTFINIYPQSDSLERCNMLIDELRRKLEKKSFKNAKLYHTTGYDLSAVTALNLFVKNNPGSKYREEALFLILDASVRYAVNSVFSKKEERLKKALDAYNNLITLYPDSKYRSRADALKKRIESETEKITQK